MKQFDLDKQISSKVSVFLAQNSLFLLLSLTLSREKQRGNFKLKHWNFGGY